MPRNRKSSSQWEFDGLFDEPKEGSDDPPKATPAKKVWDVSELTVEIRNLLEGSLGRVWVSGEVTNLRRQASGHMYFSLKDARSQLSCVLFRGEAVNARKLIEDGQEVVCGGELTVYAPRGQYQLKVLDVELRGIGALQVAFERLKQKLEAEGLFDPDRKREIPTLCRRLGLITSPTGAAIRDVLHVLQRRQRHLEVLLAPCRVQGDEATGEIVDALALLNEWSASEAQAGRAPIDAILVTRGGGSLEDLWAFNEEPVARAIVASAIAVISAVGHEIDFTIADFVADFRAATPSAAAEIITEGMVRARERMVEGRRRLFQLTRSQVASLKDRLGHGRHRLQREHPRRKLQEASQRLDDLGESLRRACLSEHRNLQRQQQALASRWQRVSPSRAIDERQETLIRLRRELVIQARRHLERKTGALQKAAAKLHLLSPEDVLARGYSITFDAATGAVIRTATAVHPGQPLRTRTHDGEIQSTVKS